ncbi:SDR family oxidoreductase [Pseudomonas sp. P9_2]|uniref:SDR family NAD(P)-dependent oxidoreductase n=1 Tax=Pseudomonas sp. P9_2 TaxID=3043447 RepID=UPI002A3588B0|nr:SDR family oxidoreductase [Pseudomonas sp. P9_2]WPN52035.1 SDR family oxidoreductase [Pseudomonas sp. P9_2]
MKVNYDFRGHTIIVAGAASGIGRATALACRDAGATVEAVDIDEKGLQPLRADGLSVHVLDIANAQAVQTTVEAIVARTGRLDGVVLTSAIQTRTTIEALSDAEWQRHLDVNLSGIFYFLRAVFPVMKQQQSGSIIAFTSGLASNGWPGASAYATTKAGIIGLVKSAAHELREHGVRINAVSPGLVATPVFLNSASEEELAMYERSLGISSPQEVVPTLMHLLSEAALTISGNVIERRLIPRSQFQPQPHQKNTTA